MAACEALVKKQYSLLEWEYTETASDDVPVCGKRQSIEKKNCVFVLGELPSHVHQTGLIQLVCLKATA